MARDDADPNNWRDVCGITYSHSLIVIDQRDGLISLECTRCGAEIFYEGDEW